MKKIRLLDKICLTDRFMEGRLSLVLDAAISADGKESVTRDGKYFVFSDGKRIHCRFSEGDSMPVVMSYSRAGLDRNVFGNSPGWNDRNKVNAKYLPHRMVVEGVRCVRAQDLTEEEALRAGMTRNQGGYYLVGGKCGGSSKDWKVMFSSMFNMMFKVMYGDNPWVIVYDVTPVVAI